ncbi:hypothetical protein NERG_02670 [Nematocida ausubeli]|uniref:Uncharacterized protein n=1 Tax=Nematocida ausubeli (strain ATCC PRA-371 / ERTm2) TaxID=1913371 RepID=H8ZGE9_NEMA1|nr:hypothetical protein NERG_02670 [Nematocida ausubeli]
MSSCSLCMRILTCSCISVSGPSDTLLFSLCVYICTEILQYFIIFIIPVCPDIMHSVCTYTCLSHTLAHKLIPALSYTVIWPFCPSVYSPNYTYQYHSISLGRPVCVLVFSLYAHSQAVLLFLCLATFGLYFPLFSRVYTENTFLFY